MKKIKTSQNLVPVERERATLLKNSGKKINLIHKALKETKQKGITMLSLVITIIVLLILSGVSISAVIGENGLISKARNSEQEKNRQIEKTTLEIIVNNWSTDRTLNDNITEEDLFTRIIKSGIVEDRSKITGSDGVYEVTTKTGNIFEIIIDEKGNTSVECIGINGKLISKITKIEVIHKTTKSIQIEVGIKRPGENGTYTYEYKKEKEEEYRLREKESNKNTCNFDDLEQNTNYKIRVTYTSSNGTVQEEKIVTTIELRKLAINITDDSPNWDENSHTATVKLETKETLQEGTKLQYQVNSIEGIWEDYTEEGIANINHKDTIYARITDGKNESSRVGIIIYDSIKPNITVEQGSITTKTITVNVTSKDGQAGMETNPTYYYYIKKSTESTYPDVASHEGKETSYTFENLEQDTNYDIKVTAKDKAENEGQGNVNNIKTNKVGEASPGLKIGNIIAEAPNWNATTHRASIKLTTNTGLIIQWQKNAIEENGWNTSDTAVDLKHNDTVFARLTDGKNIGGAASISIIDGQTPEPAQINITPNNVTTGQAITATVNHIDNQSGIVLANCKWTYTTSGGAIGTDNTKIGQYTGTFSNSQIVFSIGNPGTYYLHTLSVDEAGNRRESIAGPITVIQLATGINVSPTTVSITTGQIVKINANITPNNTSNQAITWRSNNTGIATVDSNGNVRGIAPGTATITATTADGTNRSASCTVTVVQLATGISVNPTTVTINSGNSTNISATVTPSNATNKAVTWSSSNTGVATVDGNGRVTGTGGGTAIITATTADGTNKSASCTVTVNIAPQIKNVTYASKTINSITVTARAEDSNGDNLTYELYTSTSQNSGFERKAISNLTSSGTQVTLTASGLNNYTYYYYYIRVIDTGNLSTTGTTQGAIRTYCPGNTKDCYGPFTEQVNCGTCGGQRINKSSYCRWKSRII